jgi:hypothetical protein
MAYQQQVPTPCSLHTTSRRTRHVLDWTAQPTLMVHQQQKQPAAVDRCPNCAPPPNNTSASQTHRHPRTDTRAPTANPALAGLAAVTGAADPAAAPAAATGAAAAASAAAAVGTATATAGGATGVLVCLCVCVCVGGGGGGRAGGEGCCRHRMCIQPMCCGVRMSGVVGACVVTLGVQPCV